MRWIPVLASSWNDKGWDSPVQVRSHGSVPWLSGTVSFCFTSRIAASRVYVSIRTELPWNSVCRIHDLAPSAQWSQYQAISDVFFHAHWQCPLPLCVEQVGGPHPGRRSKPSQHHSLKSEFFLQHQEALHLYSSSSVNKQTVSTIDKYSPYSQAWRERSVVENTGCSYRGPRFSF